ncbi:ribonuclease D [Aureimonas altamirensis DSM 21988]|jgi:ribonuclease D|uniref:3'-5' exonuclease n=2 Tax=Aureimonas altamirensis TaxID=370622 RepID=A0A0P0YV89_9HYPH|nr:ribonuclease D [Aureimonas altamirensis]UHD46100.1 ribonuclease D [Aureimonas altamirensis]BAT25290.1 3'-5' exonuclease [Aureimonas altamirensis]SHJ96746.1 ribonuclease D [Aureimonas altamirensis DSM 21988]
MPIRVHKGDLPDLARYTGSVAIDTETLGLDTRRDRLCVVQLSPGDGSADVVQIAKGQTDAPNLKALLADDSKVKIFHYARFDMAALYHAFGVMPGPVFCTKIASRLTRTYTDRHGLKDLTKELIGVDLSKQQQSSDWAAETLSQAQIDYAASDVLYLHDLMGVLLQRLEREGRLDIARESFRYLPTRARLDLLGWGEEDIFSHSVTRA